MSSSYNRKDHLYKKAKEEGFQSRAAYKLAEIDDKYKIMRNGFSVLDLGSWPGGWLQVSSERVGASGKVVGIDLTQLEDLGLDNVTVIVGDARDDEVILQAKEALGGAADVVISDMSPKLTGIKEADQAGTVACAELTMFIADQLLKSGGTMVAKVFKGSETEQFIRSIQKKFSKLIRVGLKATRKTSNEFYIVGLEYKHDR